MTLVVGRFVSSTASDDWILKLSEDLRSVPTSFSMAHIILLTFRSTCENFVMEILTKRLLNFSGPQSLRVLHVGLWRHTSRYERDRSCNRPSKTSASPPQDIEGKISFPLHPFLGRFPDMFFSQDFLLSLIVYRTLPFG